MTKQAADIEIPTDTCTHDRIKMLIYSIISFVSGIFFLDVSAVRQISVFSLWSFRFDVFLSKHGFFGVTRVFPRSNKHFTHVGMLQSRSE